MIGRNTKRTIAEHTYLDVLVGIGILSVMSLVLLSIRIVATDSLRYGFLVWNLFLAWIPAVMAWRIVHLATKRLRTQAFIWLIAWVLFLPNTFYILSDLIHLDSLGGISKLYDSVMLFSFSLTGIALGIVSAMIIHVWILRYVKPRTAWISLGVVIFLSSFAIYLGRYLRWNSWDVIVNPLGILFDVSDRVINPGSHPRTFSTTLLFFGFLSTLYVTAWYGVKSLWRRLQAVK